MNSIIANYKGINGQSLGFIIDQVTTFGLDTTQWPNATLSQTTD